ncbi:MAG: YihY/virulence factor BrkB family protein [Sphingomonadales bacterium]|nr:YihY/virulence factor BrkB family protein [Sphingomonadales bacterium]
MRVADRLIGALKPQLNRLRVGHRPSVPLYDLMEYLVKQLRQSDLNLRASAIGFSFFLALFPGLLFLFTLIAYIPVPGLDLAIRRTSQELLPPPAFDLLYSTIEDIVGRQQGGLLSFGFLLAFYFATTGLTTLSQSFNISLEVRESRGFIRQQLTTLGLTILLTLCMLSSLLLILLGDFLLGEMNRLGWMPHGLLPFLLNVLLWMMIVLLVYMGIGLLYYFAPNAPKRHGFFAMGSALATLLFIGSSLGFSYYVQHFGNYNHLYGSLATLIVLMLWIYVNAWVILIGFEMNSALYVRRSLGETSDASVSEKEIG